MYQNACMSAWGSEMHKIFFSEKKGMTCHNFLQVLKVIEKKNKF